MSEKRESNWVLIGLCAIVASTLVVEIALTKFFAYKVFHHFTYAVLSLVILGFGASGTYVYLRPKAFGENQWSYVARYGAYYGISIMLALVIFAWVPLDPYDMESSALARAISLPVYFLLFTIPFFLAGVCVSYTLIASKRSVTRIYAWDLFAAAAGAAATPFILRWVGGYGTFVLAGVGGMLTYYAFQQINPDKSPSERAMWPVFIAVAATVLWYPNFAIDRYGFDVRSTKDEFHRVPFLNDFDGIATTYWNEIARIDVSHTGTSTHLGYNYGLAKRYWDDGRLGRYILQDGGANTRQFRVDGDVREQAFLGDALWASPYITRPGADRVLVIGGGGGIDILEAKYFNTPEVDVAELNQATVGLITGTIEDPERDDYLPWLVSDDITKVSVYNAEGRHFGTTQPDENYDVILASGVDTLTAITSGGKSLVENYLYTVEAVEDYMRLLKPDGVLSLTHWRTKPPLHNLRMFLTYLKALERAGVEDAYKHVAVIADDDWTNSLLSKEPFTETEIQRLRNWVKTNERIFLFDPYDLDAAPDDLRWKEKIFWNLGRLKGEERAVALNDYANFVAPVFDDSPYFYRMNKISSFKSAFLGGAVYNMFIIAVIASLVLILAPLLRLQRSDLSVWSLEYAAFFASAGFAFLLFQTTIIQLFTVFVGGPVYTLAVVLVAVLAGYATGSWIAGYLQASRLTFMAISSTIVVLMGAIYLFSADLLAMALPWELPARLALCGAITFVISVFTGMPVPLAMSAVRTKHGNVVAWMWGISSAFNVLGAMSFVPLTQVIGISGALLVAAALYLLAGIGACFSPLTAKSAAAV